MQDTTIRRIDPVLRNVDVAQEAWLNLPEGTKRKIFHDVYRVDQSFFHRMSKKIHGFSPHGLSNRPSGINKVQDKLLFTIDDGKFFRSFFGCYFMAGDPALNHFFLDKFKSLLGVDELPGSNVIADEALGLVKEEFSDVKLVEFYGEALRICEPALFSDEPPNVEDFLSEPEKPTKETYDAEDKYCGADEPLPKEKVLFAEDELDAGGLDQENEVIDQSASDSQDVNGSNIGPECRVNDFSLSRASFVNEFRVLPLKESSLLWGSMQAGIQELTRDFEKYKIGVKAFDEKLGQLGKLKLRSDSLDISIFISKYESVTLDEAIDCVIADASTISAILEKHAKYGELQQDLGLPPCITNLTSSDLEILLAQVNENLKEAEVHIQALQSDRNFLQEFYDNVASCDFQSLDALLREDESYLLRLVQACLRCFEVTERTSNSGKRNAIPHVVSSTVLFYESIISIIFSILWNGSKEDAVDLLEGIILSHESWMQKVFISALSGLSFNDLYEVSDKLPQLSDIIAELTLLACIAWENYHLLPWLQTLIHVNGVSPSLKDFLNEVTSAYEQGSLMGDLRKVSGIDTNNTQSDGNEEKERTNLEQLISRPGLDGNYHKLRDAAREMFLEPVMDLVHQRKAIDAVRLWKGYGKTSSMCEECRKQVHSTIKIEERHFNKVGQHIESFGVALERWQAAIRGKKSNENRALKKSLSQYSKHKSDSSSSFEIPRDNFLSVLTDCLSGKDDSKLIPPRFFGRLASISNMVDGQFISPDSAECWVTACNSENNEVSTYALLAERLLTAFDNNRKTKKFVPVDFLDSLLDRKEVISAITLAGKYPELSQRLDEKLSELRTDFISSLPPVWEKAKSLRDEDEAVSLWADEIELLATDNQFDEIDGLIPDLAIAVERAMLKTSAVYREAIEFLESAGYSTEMDSYEEILKAVDLAKQDAVARRQHIIPLEEVALSNGYDEEFKIAVAEIVRINDIPSKWLDEPIGKEIGEAVSILLNFLQTKARWKVNKPAAYTDLSSGVRAFLSDRLEKLNDDGCQKSLCELAIYIEADGWEADEVLDYVRQRLGGDIPLSVQQSDDPQRKEEISSEIHALMSLSGKTTSQVSVKSAREVIQRIKLHVSNRLKNVEPDDVPEDIDRHIRNLCKGQRWNKVLPLLPTIIQEEASDEEWISSYEVISCAVDLGITVAEKKTIHREELSSIALGLLSAIIQNNPRDSYYYIDRNVLVELLIDCVLIALDRQWIIAEKSGRQSQLSKSLSHLAGSASSDLGFKWVYQLFTQAGVLVHERKNIKGSSVLASEIWDYLTGLNDPASGRADLLMLGYHMNLVDDFVSSLAEAHASRYSHLIIEFLKSVRSTEANPDAWDAAMRLAQSFHEQVPQNKMKPWRLLVARLNVQKKTEAQEESCQISLESCSKISDTRFNMELCLSPSKYAVLEKVELSIGDVDVPDANQIFNLLEEGKTFARQQIVRVDVNINESAAQSDVIVFPYHLTGMTTDGTDFDIRERWSVTVAKTKYTPLSLNDIDRLWVGAEGSPVASDAFHGREEERSLLQRLLEGQDGRQRSAMIIGQRRIGKTSFLKEMLRDYIPRAGHVCGIYSEVAGLTKNSPDEPLAKMLFDRLTSCSTESGENSEFRNIMRQKLGSTWHRDLTRGLSPANSIAGALSTFAENVENATKGEITRLAFFVDEFQGIFKYEAEVDQVMWGLRPIVQMSPNISLVLAGSGLARSLTNQYDQAFFGSIETIPIHPFRRDKEFDAVAETLLPQASRCSLCPDESKIDPIVRLAFDLTGGHPWFLSMLGRFAAKSSNGRPITPPLLAEVAHAMVSGDAGGHSGEVDASRFYGYLFDSLDSLGKARFYCRIVLTNIAKQVTLEFPWLTSSQAITGPVIDQEKLSSSICIDALKKLKDEDILDYKLTDGVPMYKIRIPLIAEAVRWDAHDIETEARISLENYKN